MLTKLTPFTHQYMHTCVHVFDLFLLNPCAILVAVAVLALGPQISPASYLNKLTHKMK